MEFLLLFVIILSAFIFLTDLGSLGEETEKKTKKKENKYRNSFNSYDSSYSDYDDFENSYRDYKRRQREKLDDDERKSDKIINLLVKDFNANPYSDKTNVVTGSLIYYKFENGYELKLVNDWIMLEDRMGSTLGLYKLNNQQYHRILDIFLDIARNSTRRPSNDWDKKYNEYKNSQGQQNRSQNTQSKPKQETTTGNPKLDKLNEKIKLRQEQLDKLPRNHKDRESLQNELNAYKRAAERIKSKS